MRTLLLAAALLLPGAAAAGPALGLRVGYAVSAGDAAKGTPMSDVAKSEVPLQLDALWRFGPHFSAGVYYAFGFGQLGSAVSDECATLGATCSTWTMRLGLEGQWAFTEVSPMWAPWVGAGIGYEWARDRVSRGGQSNAQDVSGWELLNLEAGADFKVAPKLVVGPYVNVRFAEYTRLDGFAVVNKTWHEWYGLGVRGRWDF